MELAPNRTHACIEPLAPAPEDHTESARLALERVCSGAALGSAHQHYSKDFVDHINDREFRGLEGVQRSVGSYRRVLKDMSIQVREQVADRGSVASRFVVSGTCFGKRVQFNGITISRFDSGLIVEDWSVTDTLAMARQVGIVRAVLAALMAEWSYRT